MYDRRLVICSRLNTSPTHPSDDLPADTVANSRYMRHIPIFIPSLPVYNLTTLEMPASLLNRDMKLTAIACVLVSLVYSVRGQSGAYGQCGGIGWTGATTCVSGYTCQVGNPYYSQCLPVTATTSASGTSTASGGQTSSSSSASSTSSGGQTSTSTSTGATPTGSQIRSDQDPAFHFYLQNNDGSPILGPESSSGYFTIGSTISLSNGTGEGLYLNVVESVSTSYKPLTFNTTANTTDWGLEGDTIITTSPRQINFLVCETSNASFYSVYLQEGNDMPSGLTCTSDISLHLPCLC